MITAISQNMYNTFNSLFSFLVPNVQAGSAIGGPTIALSGGAGEGLASRITDFGLLINSIINIIFVIGLSLSLIFVIIGGIQYVTAGNNQDKAEQARNTITNAIIGAVVIVAFRVIINVVLNILGLENFDAAVTS